MTWNEMVNEFNEYKIAAENGDAAAQCALAHCYLNGDGVQTSMKNGKMWFERSAAQGYADAQYYLVFLYLYRKNPDIENAEIWFEKAAAQGHAKAQVEIGRSLLGRGEYEKAAEMFAKAAAQGDEDAILFDEMMKQRYWENPK